MATLPVGRNIRFVDVAGRRFADVDDLAAVVAEAHIRTDHTATTDRQEGWREAMASIHLELERLKRQTP